MDEEQAQEVPKVTFSPVPDVDGWGRQDRAGEPEGEAEQTEETQERAYLARLWAQRALEGDSQVEPALDPRPHGGPPPTSTALDATVAGTVIEDSSAKGEKNDHRISTISALSVPDAADFKLHNTEQSTINLRPIPCSDPNDPLNWPRWRKMYNMTIVCLFTLFCYAMLCIAVPSWTTMGQDLGWKFSQFNNSYALGLAGTGVGCIFLIPLAIEYGRRPVYVIATLLMVVFTAWSAKMTRVWELYVTHIIMGVAASTAEIMIQMTISDLFFLHERATMNGMYLIFCYLGNNMSQVAGGYVTSSQGWRWNYWYSLIFVALLELVTILSLEETKFVVAGGRLSFIPLTNPTLDQNGTKPWVNRAIARRPMKQRFSLMTRSRGPRQPLIQRFVGPCLVLFKFPVVLFVAVEYGLTVAWTSMMSTSASKFLGEDPYNFSVSAIGNINIAPFVGTVIGTIVGGYICDWSVVWISKWKSHEGVFQPEMRLYSALLPSLAIIASLFMFGHGLGHHENWAVAVVAYGICSFGGTAMSGILLTYLMDCYTEVIGQCLVGVVFVQNIVPMVMVFGLDPWTRAVGIDNVMYTCGAISIVATIGIGVMIAYGGKVRAGYREEFDKFRMSYIRNE